MREVTQSPVGVHKPAGIPGEDVSICYANLSDNNQDCVIVNKSSVDRGLFSGTAMSRHVLHKSELVPPVVKTVETSTHRWWKENTPHGISASGVIIATPFCPCWMTSLAFKTQ